MDNGRTGNNGRTDGYMCLSTYAIFPTRLRSRVFKIRNSLTRRALTDNRQTSNTVHADGRIDRRTDGRTTRGRTTRKRTDVRMCFLSIFYSHKTAFCSKSRKIYVNWVFKL